MIQIGEIPPLDLKEAIERSNQGEVINVVTHEILEREIKRIAREAWALLRPQNLMYVAAVPSTLDEGQAVLYYDGANYKIYVKIAGNIKSATLA